MKFSPEEIATRLRAEAEQGRHTWAYILKLYALEGMIRRAAAHPKAGEMVIRGSLITRAWVLPHYRPVDDVDFLADYPFDSARGVGFVREALAQDLEDFLAYDVQNMEVVPTWVETPLPGERIMIPTRALGEDFTLQIDLAYNDPLMPPAVDWEYPTLIPEWRTKIRTIAPELACAWKVHGLFEFAWRGSTAWEMKDLYDIFLIIRQFALDEATFDKALQQAFTDRKTPMSVYNRVLEGIFGQSTGTLKNWDKFYVKREGRLLVDNHFVLLREVRAFLDKFFLPFCDVKFRQ